VILTVTRTIKNDLASQGSFAVPRVFQAQLGAHIYIFDTEFPWDQLSTQRVTRAM
jgi:hypothetical protein